MRRTLCESALSGVREDVDIDKALAEMSDGGAGAEAMYAEIDRRCFGVEDGTGKAVTTTVGVTATKGGSVSGGSVSSPCTAPFSAFSTTSGCCRAPQAQSASARITISTSAMILFIGSTS